MVRRLLFFPILRTRSARKIVVGRSVILFPLLATTAGCETQAPKQDTEPTSGTRQAARSRGDKATAAPTPGLARELEQLEAEAGIDTITDPSPPSGDLKSDVDAFTTLDACVRERTVTDPLIGDAIDALGYDTLARDACRILQALKEKSPVACRPIASSALRARCESYLAVAAADPNLCPMNGSGRLAAREPVCLARASRDERLCAAAPVLERATCRALVLGKKAECGDNSCVRQVERYRGLFEKPASHPALPAHLHVEVALETSTPEQAAKSFDLDDVAAAGAIVRVGAASTRIAVGSAKTPTWPEADSPDATPKAFLEVSVPASSIQGSAASAKKNSPPPTIALGATDVRIDLLVPNVALLSALLASNATVELRQMSADPGAPIKLVLTATLRDAPRTFRVKFDVETFVRERSTAPDTAGP
jgi:hypothetical protein